MKSLKWNELISLLKSNNDLSQRIALQFSTNEKYFHGSFWKKLRIFKYISLKKNLKISYDLLSMILDHDWSIVLYEITLPDLGILVKLNQSTTSHELIMHHVKTRLNKLSSKHNTC